MPLPKSQIASELSSLEQRVADFVRDPSAKDFDVEALAVIQLQALALPGYERLYAARTVDPEHLDHWRQAPPIPTSAFQHQPLTLRPAELVFRSSGTTQGQQQRSEHHHANLDLYRLIVDSSFPRAVLKTHAARLPPARPILSLIAPRSLIQDSSLSFMTDHVVHRYGAPRSGYAFRDGLLDPAVALEWLRAEASRGSAPVLLTTALALWSLLETLDAADPTDRSVWPEGLTIMETGGFKTRRFDLTREDLMARLKRATASTPMTVVREYGMTELTSQAYASSALGGDEDLFVLPPWVRVRALDPVTMNQLSDGETGLLAFLDLGNVASAASIVTEDLGSVEHNGCAFRLEGRAKDAQLRGCSLTTEALLAS